MDVSQGMDPGRQHIKAESESVEKSNTISPPPLKDIMFILFPIFSQVQTLLL